MEKRLRLLETTLETYGRRHSDCEAERVMMKQLLVRMEARDAAYQETLETMKDILETLRRILKALAWVGVAAKWIITIGGAFAVLFSAMRWVAGRML